MNGAGRVVGLAALGLVVASGGMEGAVMAELAGNGLVSDPTDRVMSTEIVVEAPLDQVWDAWTTPTGVTSFGPSKAKIELAVGGAYEWYFVPDAPEGQRGAEGCTVLSFVPKHYLAFTWNAPPSIAELREAGARTQVHVTFTDLGGERVQVSLKQFGFGRGEAWDEYYAYFAKAWRSVLKALASHFGGGEASTDAEKLKQYVYFIEPARKTFEQDATDDENRIVSAHFAYLQKMFANGRLLLAGRTMDEKTPFGAVVFEAESDEAAEAVFKSDPAVKAGVFVGNVRPYGVALMRRE